MSSGGDLTGDGHADLVLRGLGSTQPGNDSAAIALLHGAGDGTFQLAQTLSQAGFSAYGGAIANFTGSGPSPAMIVRHYADNGLGDVDTVSIFPVSGGSLQTPIEVTLPSLAVDVAAADLNGDGRPDLVVNSPGKGVLTYLQRPDSRTRASGPGPAPARGSPAIPIRMSVLIDTRPGLVGRDLTVRGRLVTRGRASPARRDCRGRVIARLLAPHRRVDRATGRITRSCAFSVHLAAPRRLRAVLQLRFPGNGSLAPTAITRHVQV
jgi:hypothetical protein